MFKITLGQEYLNFIAIRPSGSSSFSDDLQLQFQQPISNNPHSNPEEFIQCQCLTNDVLPSDGLAWDWINEKLYWTDPEDLEIEVYDPATDHRRSLLSTGTTSIPRGLAVDPKTRYILRGKTHISFQLGMHAVVNIIAF